LRIINIWPTGYFHVLSDLSAKGVKGGHRGRVSFRSPSFLDP
jgi:hypothetical protein